MTGNYLVLGAEAMTDGNEITVCSVEAEW